MIKLDKSMGQVGDKYYSKKIIKSIQKRFSKKVIYFDVGGSEDISKTFNSKIQRDIYFFYLKHTL